MYKIYYYTILAQKFSHRAKPSVRPTKRRQVRTWKRRTEKYAHRRCY